MARIAWVTGAGSGMGLSGAQQLAAAGATVVMSGRRGDVLEREADAIRNAGGKADVEALDVRDAAAVQRVADAILARHGKVDILVNSAGLNNPQRAWRDQHGRGLERGHPHQSRRHVLLHPRRAAVDARAQGRAPDQHRVVGRQVHAGHGGRRLQRQQARGRRADGDPSTWRNASTASARAPSAPPRWPRPILDRRPVPPSPEERARMLQGRRHRPDDPLDRRAAGARLRQRGPDQPDVEPDVRRRRGLEAAKALSALGRPSAARARRPLPSGPCPTAARQRAPARRCARRVARASMPIAAAASSSADFSGSVVNARLARAGARDQHVAKELAFGLVHANVDGEDLLGAPVRHAGADQHARSRRPRSLPRRAPAAASPMPLAASACAAAMLALHALLSRPPGRAPPPRGRGRTRLPAGA